MKLAEKILKKSEIKFEKNKNGQLETKIMGIIEDLKTGKYSESNEMQKKMVEKMAILAENDLEMANKFMEFMDENASEFKMENIEKKYNNDKEAPEDNELETLEFDKANKKK